MGSCEHGNKPSALVNRVEFLIDLNYCVRFEVFTAVTMKNAVFWDVTPCVCRRLLTLVPRSRIFLP
jgi:hypothetical protein